MDKITFYHCGDIHFDIPFTTLSQKIGLPQKRRNDIKDSFLKVIDHVKKDKPDYLFIAGDLYEHEYSGQRTIIWINEKFSEIEETTVIMIAGNHDPEAGNSFYRTFHWNKNVFFLGEKINHLEFEKHNLVVYGIGFGPGYGQSIRLNDMVCETNKVNILLFHGDIDIDIGERDYNAISSKALESKGFDYIAASHNHQYRNNYGKQGIIHNAGSLEPLGFDEEGEHGFIKGEIEEKKLKTTFINLEQQRYKSISLEIDNCKDDKELMDNIRSKLTDESLLYRIVLTGKKEISLLYDIKEIEKRLNEKVLFLRIKDDTKVKTIKTGTEKQSGLKGIYLNKIKEAMENATEEEKEILGKALIYGVKAIEEEKVETGIEETL